MEGTGIILLNNNNEVLLLLRDNNAQISFPNMWDIPGGQIEDNETPAQAIKREMIEEMNLTNLGEINLFKIYKSAQLNDYIFWKRIDLNPSKIILNEGQRIEYFNLDRIRKTKLAFNYNDVLEEFFISVVSKL